MVVIGRLPPEIALFLINVIIQAYFSRLRVCAQEGFVQVHAQRLPVRTVTISGVVERAARTSETGGTVMDEIRRIRKERWEASLLGSLPSQGSNRNTAVVDLTGEETDGIRTPPSIPSMERMEALVAFATTARTDRDESCANEMSNSKLVEAAERKAACVENGITCKSRKRQKRYGTKEDVPSLSAKVSSVRSSSLVLALASYNIWFGPPHQSARMAKIASILTHELSPPPILVGLQEVTPDLAKTLFPLLAKDGYEIHQQDLSSMTYGCAVAVRTACHGGRRASPVKARTIESGFLPYSKTIMGRGFAWVLVEVSSGEITNEVLFGSTHLESYMPNYPRPGERYDGVAERRSQIIEVCRFCDEFMRRRTSVVAAIVTGDLNWDDERKKSCGADKPLLPLLWDDDDGHDLGQWSDAWLDAHPNEEGYTYDAKKSPMLGGNLRRRFDRCLVRGRGRDKIGYGEQSGAALPVTNFHVVKEAILFGEDCIPGLYWEKEVQKWSRGGLQPSGQVKRLPVLPSDHFGLSVSVELNAVSGTKTNGDPR